jgi:hypothetical protein
LLSTFDVETEHVVMAGVNLEGIVNNWVPEVHCSEEVGTAQSEFGLAGSVDSADADEVLALQHVAKDRWAERRFSGIEGLSSRWRRFGGK